MGAKEKVLEPESVLRWSLASFLSVCFAAYATTSIAKYRDKNTGLSIGTRSQNYIKFPTIVVCSEVNGFVPFHNHRPWINFVWSTHWMVSADGDGLGPMLNSGFKMARQNVSFQFNETASPYLDSDTFREFYLPMSTNHYYCNSFDHPTGAWNTFGLTNLVMLSLDVTSLLEKTPFLLVTALNSSTMNLYDALQGAIFIPVMSTDILVNDFKRFSVISMQFMEKNSLPMDQEGRRCLDNKEFAAQLNQHGTLLDCTEEYFMTAVPCFRNIVQAESDMVDNYPCSWEEQTQLGQVSDKLVENGKEKYLDSVGCQLPCNQTTYTLRLEATYEAFDWFGSPPNAVNVLLFAQSGTTTIVTEYLIFDLPALAAAVGGMMGMMLGASFLTVFDAISWMVKALLRRI